MNPNNINNSEIPRTEEEAEKMNSSNGKAKEAIDLDSLITYKELLEITVGSVPGDPNLVRIINNDGVEEIVQINYVNEYPPGYHFIPNAGELIIFYLKEKINGRDMPYNNIPEVQLYKFTPQQLTEKYQPQGENLWLFFSPRDRKYPNGSRPNRAAGVGPGSGYWKATGSDKPVHNKEEGDTDTDTDTAVVIGNKKSLVFYQGRPPRGTKTDWIMNEYRLDGANHKRKDEKDMKLDDWVLCQIYKKPEKEADKKTAHKPHKPARNRGRPSRVQEPAVETSPVADTTNNLGDIDYQVNETVGGGGGHYPQAFSNGPHMVDTSFQNLRFRSNFPGQTSSTTMVPNQMTPMYDPTVFKQESSHNVGYYNHFAQPTYSGFLSPNHHNVGQSSMNPYGFQQEPPHNFGQSSDRQNMFSHLAEPMFSRLAEPIRAEAESVAGYNVEYAQDPILNSSQLGEANVPGSCGLIPTETRGPSLPTSKYPSSQYYMSPNPAWGKFK